MMQVKEVATGMGDAYWPFDLDFKDNAGANHGQGDEFVTIDNETFKGGIGSALFSGQEESENGQLHAGTDLQMGVGDEFSVFLWLKTTDDEGFIFGKSDEATNAYLQGASCIWIGDGNVNLDVAWVGGAGGSIPVNDDQWHSVVWTKTATGDVVTYIDGVKDIETTIADWSDDEGFQVTMGAGWESAAYAEWWPFTYQGYLDEVKFYQEYFTEEEVTALLTNQKAHWTFDASFIDVLGSNHGEADPEVSISNDTFIEGSGSALFEGLEEVENGQVHAGTELGMGADDDFTVTLWIKTTDDEGFLFGKSDEETNAYIQGASCIWIGDGAVNIDVAWVGGAGGSIVVNDDQWHHVAWTKTSNGDVTTYIDGVLDISDNIADWSDDEGFQITIGAGWESAAYAEWWPFAYQGYMDDVRFFQSALSASMIQSIYQENAP
jgi:hypothetical protein